MDKVKQKQINEFLSKNQINDIYNSWEDIESFSLKIRKEGDACCVIDISGTEYRQRDVVVITDYLGNGVFAVKHISSMTESLMHSNQFQYMYHFGR